MPLSKKRDRARKKIARDTAIIGCNGNGKCASCGEDRVVDRHHIDSNHDNDHPDNIITLCPTCHALITRGKETLSNLIQPKLDPNRLESEVAQPNINEELEVVGRILHAKRIQAAISPVQPKPELLTELRGLMDKAGSNTPVQPNEVPWYDPVTSKPGERVKMRQGGRIIETTVVETDADGHEMPDYT